jgi:hypothetical protein
MMSPCSGGLRDLECTMSNLAKEMQVIDKPYDEGHRELLIRIVLPHTSPMEPERIYDGEEARKIVIAFCKTTMAVVQMVEALDGIKDA